MPNTVNTGNGVGIRNDLLSEQVVNFGHSAADPYCPFSTIEPIRNDLENTPSGLKDPKAYISRLLNDNSIDFKEGFVKNNLNIFKYFIEAFAKAHTKKQIFVSYEHKAEFQLENNMIGFNKATAELLEQGNIDNQLQGKILSVLNGAMAEACYYVLNERFELRDWIPTTKRVEYNPFYYVIGAWQLFGFNLITQVNELFLAEPIFSMYASDPDKKDPNLIFQQSIDQYLKFVEANLEYMQTFNSRIAPLLRFENTLAYLNESIPFEVRKEAYSILNKLKSWHEKADNLEVQNETEELAIKIGINLNAVATKWRNAPGDAKIEDLGSLSTDLDEILETLKNIESLANGDKAKAQSGDIQENNNPFWNEEQLQAQAAKEGGDKHIPQKGKAAPWNGTGFKHDLDPVVNKNSGSGYLASGVVTGNTSAKPSSEDVDSKVTSHNLDPNPKNIMLPTIQTPPPNWKAQGLLGVGVVALVGLVVMLPPVGVTVAWTVGVLIAVAALGSTAAVATSASAYSFWSQPKLGKQADHSNSHQEIPDNRNNPQCN